MRIYKDASYTGDIVVMVARVAHGDTPLRVATTSIGLPPRHVLVRVHDQCATSEIFGSLKCDCRLQLDAALREMNAAAASAFESEGSAGRDLSRIVGVLVFLPQEGRGVGLAAKVAAYALQEKTALPEAPGSVGRSNDGLPPQRGLDTVDANRALGLPDDSRHYGAVPPVLAHLGLIQRDSTGDSVAWSLGPGSKPLSLLTNNPRKLELLASLGVPFDARQSCLVPVTSQHASEYLRAKSQRMGHDIPEAFFAAASVQPEGDSSGAAPRLDVNAGGSRAPVLLPEQEDPPGVALIAERIASVPGLLVGMAAAPLSHPSAAAHASTRFLVTGTGSSEAHARYLTWLLSRISQRASASFVPLSAFLTDGIPPDPAATLVVFSQGLSPNAQIALHASGDFGHTILFTSSSATAEAAAGRPGRAALLDTLAARGADILSFPPMSEPSTLLRVVGPAAGFLAAHQFVVALSKSRSSTFSPASGHATLPRSPQLAQATPAAVSALVGLQAPEALASAMRETPTAFDGGFTIVAPAPLSGFAHNLAYKFMEGLYWRCPQVVELISFAHGPFQQLSLHPQPVVILQSSAPGEAALVARCSSMLDGAGIPRFVVRVDAPPELAVIGFEALFNPVSLSLSQR